MTSVCVVTPAGRGAVATIVVRGDLQSIDDAPPLFQAACQQPISALPIDRVAFGRWGASPGEEVVVCRTTPDRLEIHCHGGAAATARILADLRSRGSLVNADSRFEHEGRDVLDRECREAVSRATTLRTADLLLQQASGLLRREYERLAEMDRGAAARHVDELLGRARLGLHLTQPWRVVLCGRPNVGKSSLINALVGFSRSIVFDQPGTTRDVVTAETALDGWPVLLSDTAGLRDGADELESAGIARARRQIADAELRIVVIDASTHQSED
ncbi:MAG: 50S ribosome-binding GTPase, partial [Planctomycetaceae bacterium]|nr:50S ribosome-binding GTPase [Planctomycetaceae bacterium]